MDTIFKITTTHTEEVIRAYAKIFTKQNSSKAIIRYAIIAGLFILAPKLLKLAMIGKIISWVGAALVFVLLFSREYLTFVNMLNNDIYYKTRKKIIFEFCKEVFYVNTEEKKIKHKYKEIDKIYTNKTLFFIHMKDRSLYIIPKEHIDNYGIDIVEKDTEKEDTKYDTNNESSTESNVDTNINLDATADIEEKTSTETVAIDYENITFINFMKHVTGLNPSNIKKGSSIQLTFMPRLRQQPQRTVKASKNNNANKTNKKK
ncbi:MAG: YcxB family protein [Eubacteriales bacterium]|nr:YcxB family protein [Eubacteriales bacterium]MDY3332273.1 YcxB family protein [Gallibacter sp.]